MEQLYLLLIIIGGFGLLVTGALRYELTSLLIICALILTGVLEPSDALSGLSSPAFVTVGAMFVVSAGLLRTGALEVIVERLAALSRGRTRRLMLLLTVVVPVASAFMNNTAVVVLFIPVLLMLSRRFRVPASKFLLPLSYLSILGGTCTLLGSTTNLLVDDVYRGLGGPGFGLFEFARVGVAYIVVGGAYIILAGPRLLPSRQIVSGMLEPSERKEYVTEVVIGAGSDLVGRTLEEIGESHPQVKILEIVRGETVHWPPFEKLEVQPGDVWFVRTEPQVIYQAVGAKSFEIAPELRAEASSVRGTEQRIAELLVLPGSPLLGMELGEVGFHRRWDANVLGVQRRGHHLRGSITSLPLEVGDLLLVQADDGSMERLRERSRDFAVLDDIRHSLIDRKRTPVAILIMISILGMAMAGVDLAAAALVGCLAMILSGCVSSQDAFRALDGSILMLLAGTIPLGVALEETGLADRLAQGLLGNVTGDQVHLLVATFYGITMVLTTFLSNTATVSLMTPIALSTAASVGIPAHMLVLAVVFGGNACFMSPIGYQTNALVLAPGGYTFADYLRFGAPLNLILWILTTALVPTLW